MTSTQKAVDFVSRFSFLVSRFSFLAISVFLIATPTNAQIKIKEKVEINSGNILYASSISTIHHTFTYVLSWTPEQNRRGNIRIIDCNGDTLNSGITTSGYTTISFPANGHHQFLFQEERWFYRNFYGWGWWGDIHPGRLLEVYIDDNKLNHPQNVIGHTYGLPNDFDLKFNGSICPNDYAVLSIGNVNWDNCNLPCFYDGDEAELSIIQGSEYVEFVDILSETLLGSSIHLSDYNNISNIGLKRKDDAPIVHDIQIIRVEGNINGVKDTSMIEYYPDEFVPSVDVYPETLTTGERINIDISYYSQCGPLPPETRINIEIINGAEYGNLIDPYTNERIKTITNLDHWWGYAWVEFIADGNSTKQLDTITLRITTTDQAIMPNEALLIIKPPPIYVYTVPEVLGADDTADVIIQHRLEDGTLEDFPLEQTFELAVLDGCINGNFMVGDSINVYFEDALQPIKFVTSDTLDSEVKNILIRVGTNLDEGGGGGISRPIGNLGGEEIKAVDTLRVGFEKMMAEKRAAAEKKENNEPPIEAPIVKQCALDEPTYTTYWKGFTSVGDECENYPCSSIQLFPPLKIKTKPIYENVVKGLNLCYENSAGVTVFPFDNKPISPFYSDLVFDKDLFVRYEVDACFNKLANNGDGGWQFLISSEGEEHTIKLNVYIALCLDQISLTKITNKSQLESIPKDYVCAALKDFDNARPYQFSNSKLPKPKFYHIVDVTLIHEHVHKKFFEVDIKSVIEKSIYYNGKLLTYAQHFAYTPNCNNEYWELTSAISAGKNYFRDLFKKFAKDLEKESNIRSLNKYENENYTQWNTLVQDMITQYQEALIKIWKDKNLPKNESPLTNCNYTFKDKWKAFDKWRNIFEY